MFGIENPGCFTGTSLYCNGLQQKYRGSQLTPFSGTFPNLFWRPIIYEYILLQITFWNSFFPGLFRHFMLQKVLSEGVHNAASKGATLIGFITWPHRFWTKKTKQVAIAHPPQRQSVLLHRQWPWHRRLHRIPWGSMMRRAAKQNAGNVSPSVLHNNRHVFGVLMLFSCCKWMISKRLKRKKQLGIFAKTEEWTKDNWQKSQLDLCLLLMDGCLMDSINSEFHQACNLGIRWSMGLVYLPKFTTNLSQM